MEMTRTIPEEQWNPFIENFSREHMGWVATIDVLDRVAGPQHVAEGLPLQGISFDTKGSRPNAIEIAAGDKPGSHVTHIVDMPLYIREARESDGSVDLQIEPARGPMTLIHLRGPVH